MRIAAHFSTRPAPRKRLIIGKTLRRQSTQLPNARPLGNLTAFAIRAAKTCIVAAARSSLRDGFGAGSPPIRDRRSQARSAHP